MNCKSCNTRMPAGLRTCPNCGRLSTKPASAARDDDSVYPLTDTPKGAEPVDLDLEEIEEIEELEDVVDNDATVVADAGTSARQSPRARRDARAQKSRPKRAAAKPAAPSRANAPKTRAAGAAAVISGISPSIDEIKSLVEGQLELLEPGLRPYTGGGHAAGQPFVTDVGEVDLLAVDDAGGLVAIMILTGSDSVAKQIVGETLQRVGWLSRHAATDGQEVRAIVLVDSLPEEVEYAAAAVGDAIDFKTWRVSVRFDALDF